ncbi:MAG: hypothetical protein FWF29_12045, partial [Treponema sp.]|nr:hypothetical protein [Treponema sp.]
FPDSAVKPIPEYTEGFRIYLENTVATQNTIQWDGTWAREWPDEYNACEGVGDMTIDRDLRLDPATSGSISNVGDYQHLVIVLGFDDADLGKTYTFTIKNVEVCGKSIIRPGLASLKDLFLKTVTPTSEPVGVTINSGTVKVKTIDIGEGVIRSQIYLTRTDTFTGPCYVSVNLPDDSALNVTQFRTYVSNTTDHSAPDGWVSDLQVDASAGGSLTGDVSTYWDGNLWSGSPSTTALTEVCIIITFADGTAENADYTFTINQIMVN